MLSGDEMRRAGVVDLDFDDARIAAAHVQPNGIDLSLDGVFAWREAGALGQLNADRVLPAREQLPFDQAGWLQLSPGTYGVRYAERVALSADCGGLCFPRSSLLRMGAHVPTAVWDAGYAGRGEGLLVVGNPAGIRLQRGTRIAQLVVFRLTDRATMTYAGQYQHENT